MKGKWGARKWLLVIFAVLFVLKGVSEFVHDKKYLPTDNPSRMILDVVTDVLETNNSLEVHQEVSSEIKKVIPVNSDPNKAIRILEDAGYDIHFHSKDTSDRYWFENACSGLREKDEIITAVKGQGVLFSFEKSSLVICLEKGKVKDLRAWVSRDAL